MSGLLAQQGLEGGAEAAFYVLVGMLLTSALVVVHARNLFHAGLGLISCFLGVAGLYLLLEAPFIAALQVLIYAGAIAVILLFAFMLTHRIAEPEPGSLFTQPVAGAVAAGLISVVLMSVALGSPWYRTAGPPGDRSVGALGQQLLTTYLLPFEVISLFLLAALVGAVVIARKEEGPRE